ncbi:unnamed protein product [Sphacelaria rigidula]
MALALTAAAIPWDNCDFRLTTSVIGVGAHMSTKAATCVAMENLPGYLSLMHKHRWQGELVATDITRGPLWQGDGEQWKPYFAVFNGAALPCGVARIAGEGGHIDTCSEIELREAIPMMQGSRRCCKYLFMQLDTTKSWSDSKAAIDRLADTRRVDERGTMAARMVAGDEETRPHQSQLLRRRSRWPHRGWVEGFSRDLD